MLIKTKIDEHTLSDALEGAKIASHVLERLRGEFLTLAAASEAMEAFKAAMPTGGDDELILEELNEIKKDLKWAATKKGKLILAYNEAAPGLYRIIRGQMGLSEVMIGGHSEKMAVVVTGRVPTERDRDKVLEIVSNALPYPVVDMLQVG